MQKASWMLWPWILLKKGNFAIALDTLEEGKFDALKMLTFEKGVARNS